jgi:hypothetical protein
MTDPSFAPHPGDASAYWAAYNAGYFAPGGEWAGKTGYYDMMGGGMGGVPTGLSAADSFVAQAILSGALMGAGSQALPVVGAGLSYGASFGDIIKAAGISGISGAISGALGIGATSALGFNTTAGKIGYAAAMALLGGSLGPFGGAAGTLGAIGGEALADLMGLRSNEAALDYYESYFGFFPSHLLGAQGAFYGGGMSGGQPGLGYTGGGDYGGASRGEGGTIGGLRSGGWATGPSSGYAATLHGTEYVLNQDQVKAVRDLVGGGRGAVVKIYFDSPELERFVKVKSQDAQIKRERRAQRGRRDTTGSTPARIF